MLDVTVQDVASRYTFTALSEPRIAATNSLECFGMRSNTRFTFSVLVMAGSFLLPLNAQLPPVKVEPLRPPLGSRDTAACSTADTSSCAQAASKLLPLILGDSPMIENLRRLTDEIGGRVTGTPEMAKAIQWGIAGFRAAGVDVHTEKYTLPATWKESPTRLEITAPRTTNNVQLRAVSEAWGPATPPGGIEASVIDI